jgi:membrane protease YdiL (CAAX protease family)
MIHTETSTRTRTIDRRVVAVLEVLVVFLATMALAWLAVRLPAGKVAKQFLIYILMMAFPLLILLVARRDLKAYGLSFHRLKDQLDMTLALFPVAALKGAVVGWLLPAYIPNAIVTWQGALILSLISVPFFFAYAWVLRRKPTIALVLPAFLLVIPLAQGNTALYERLVPFLFYLLFLGPGEEILFRGYIQSRLNAAFGRPFSFWGVHFGWGLFIASLFFGLMHILNPFNPFQLWWGVWTVFGGLAAGYVREKAGSILPPAILHGLPQAIASQFLGFFAVR